MSKQRLYSSAFEIERLSYLTHDELEMVYQITAHNKVKQIYSKIKVDKPVKIW